MIDNTENNILNLLGFEIFLINGASQDSSYILYERRTKKFNTNSKNQTIDILTKQIMTNYAYIKDLHFKLLNQDQEYASFTAGKKANISKMLVSYAIDTEVKVIDNLGYCPSLDLIFDDSNKDTNFNSYRHTKYLLGLGYLGKPYKKFPMIDKIINNLVGNSESGYNWLVQRIAAILQNPKEKLTTGIIFHGEQGTGKGIFLDTILNHILGRNYTTIQNKELESDFNGWNYAKLVVHAVEIHQTPGKDISGSLKNLCSDKFFSLRQMRTEARKTENYSTIFITSNRFIPIKIDKDDRRWSIFRSKKLKNGDNIYHTLMATFENEIENFVKYLWNIEIDYELINKPLDNKEKKSLKESCLNSVESFLSYVNMVKIENLKHLFKVDYGFESDLNTSIQSGDKFVCYSDFYIYYKSYCNVEGYTPMQKIKFKNELKNNDIESKTVKIDGSSVRCLQIE